MSKWHCIRISLVKSNYRIVNMKSLSIINSSSPLRNMMTISTMEISLFMQAHDTDRNESTLPRQNKTAFPIKRQSLSQMFVQDFYTTSLPNESSKCPHTFCSFTRCENENICSSYRVGNITDQQLYCVMCDYTEKHSALMLHLTS